MLQLSYLGPIPASILIIDDEEKWRRDTAEVVEWAGTSAHPLRPIVAATLEEGILRFRETLLHPTAAALRAALIDNNLGLTEGPDVFREMLAVDASFSHSRVALYTNDLREDAERRFREAQVPFPSHFISKGNLKALRTFLTTLDRSI